MSPGLASRFTPGKHLSVALLRALWYICNSSMLPSRVLGFIAPVMAVLHKALVATFKSVPASAGRKKNDQVQDLQATLAFRQQLSFCPACPCNVR